MVENSYMCYTTHFDTVYTNVAPTLPRPVVGPYPYNADERSSPARSVAGCEQWLENCVEASEDGWLRQDRITHMCVIFAPFRCNGLIARRGEEEIHTIKRTSKVEAVASFEGKAWPLVVLLGMGWLFLHRMVRNSSERGPIRTPSADRMGRGDVGVSPTLGVSLALGEDEVLLGSAAKWSFGDLASGNGKTVAEKIVSGSFGEFMEY